MRGHYSPGTILLGAALLVACDAQDQSRQVVEVSVAGDTLVTSYGVVAEAVWFGGERWAVLARPEEAVAIADFGCVPGAE